MKAVAVLALLWVGVCHASPLQFDDIQFDDGQPPFAPPAPPFFPAEDEQAAMWNSGKYQGDIVLTEEQERQLNSPERNALKYESSTWIPVNKVIPFTFKPNVFTESEKQQITEWLKEFEKYTCLTVKPRTNENDYVEIFDDGGCYSYIGRVGGKQPVSLGRPKPGYGHCIFKSTVLHEFMHASGFWHEQSRQDRDQYITVALQNVQDGMQGQFDIAPSSRSEDIGTYDYKSVMQYKSTAFTKNGGKTMIRKDGSNEELGQPTDGTFTQGDIGKLRALYKCGDTGETTVATTVAPTTEGVLCEDGAWWCPNYSQYCNWQQYRDYMHQHCAKTCGAC